MYEILENGQIMYIEIKDTGLQSVIVKSSTNMMEKRIILTANKTQATLEEEIIITIQWQKFDIEQGQHLNDPATLDPIQVDIAGIQDVVTPGENILFTSAEQGEYVIKSIVPGVDNAEVKVNVSA